MKVAIVILFSGIDRRNGIAEETSGGSIQVGSTEDISFAARMWLVVTPYAYRDLLVVFLLLRPHTQYEEYQSVDFSTIRPVLMMYTIHASTDTSVASIPLTVPRGPWHRGSDAAGWADDWHSWRLHLDRIKQQLAARCDVQRIVFLWSH